MTPAKVVAPAEIGRLVDSLRREGRKVVGPTRRDGAIVNDELSSADDLPVGWTDEQAPGHYRLRERDDDALFGFAVGPYSWKRELFPPRERLWSTNVTGDDTFEVVEAEVEAKPLALLGVRACELAAIAVQDRVFLGGMAVDPVYEAHRSDVLLVAVDCGDPAATCFCPSMGTGPACAGRGADLVLAELLDDGPHEFLVRAETPAGEALLGQLVGRAAEDADEERAARRTQAAEDVMTRGIDADAVHDGLLGNLEHERWDDVASRCLDCGNCTMVCPTCFCTQVEDVTDLDGSQAHHDRRWDSCFSLQYSHLGHGSVRESTRARYRQWLTHKFATWIDQFGTSGCVGCGRCLTWCPVGIDITEEIAEIVGTPAERKP